MYFNDSSNLVDKAALIDDQGYSMTYGMLKKFVIEMQERIPKRVLVFSLCTNSVASAAGYISFVANRIVPLMLNARVDTMACRNLIELYQPQYIYLPFALRNNYKEYPCVWEFNEYCLLKTNCNCNYNLYPELEVLLSTSGSTGSPKYVRMGRKSIQKNIDAVIQTCGFEEDEKYITMVPMAYLYGMHRIRCRLQVGNTILLTDKQVIDKNFWDFFGENGATSFAAVPYTYEMLEKIGFYSLQLSGLRFMSVAGGKVSKELKDKLYQYVNDKKIKFEMMYGTTENCCDVGIILLHKEGAEIGENCIGKPLPVMKWKLVDENGNEIKQTNSVGELQIESKSCAFGYAENYGDLEKGDEWNGVYNTGDLVYRGEDGYYYLAGRKQRFEKIFGNRISLDEIERMVKDFLGTTDCACVGRENQLYILVTQENQGKQKDILKYLLSKTSLYAGAFRIGIIDSIPRSTSGKVLYGKVKEYMEKSD